MVRHLSQTRWIALVLLVYLMNAPGQARAQATAAQNNAAGIGGILSDPFTFYYAYYLPNQQLTALRPGPSDSINTAMMARQYYAQTDRRALYNPISPYAEANYDPLRPFSNQQGRERLARPFRFSADPSNADGTGPSLYYGRAAQYFPHLRAGRGPNANVAPTRRPTGIRPGGGRVPGGGGGGGGGGGMGGMGMPGMGMPGMGMPGMGMPGMGMM